MDGVCEHAGDVVSPRVSVDGAAGFVVAVLLGPGVKEVADLTRRVACAAAVHFEDERQKARPGRGADRGCGRHVAVEAVALAAGCRVGGVKQYDTVISCYVTLGDNTIELTYIGAKSATHNEPLTSDLSGFLPAAKQKCSEPDF